MADKVNPIPAGYRTVTPYLSVKGGNEAIDFYKRAFGAEELFRMPGPDGKLGHAELMIGDCRIMLADEMPDMPDAVCMSPETLGGTSITLMIYLPDVDGAVDRAVAAGATIKRPLKNQFYGDRSAIVKDPFGHFWTLASHVEDVSPEEMERRMQALA